MVTASALTLAFVLGCASHSAYLYRKQDFSTFMALISVVLVLYTVALNFG